MEKIANVTWKYRRIILIAQIVICFGIFLGIYFSQKGVRQIDLSKANLQGGYVQGDGSIYIDETDGAYGLYLDVDTEEIEKGWYKVHVEYETGYDDNGFLIKPLNGNPSAINKDLGEELETIILKSQHSEKSVHVWAKEKTGLRISFHFCGGGYLNIRGIELERVANYTPLFLVAFLCIIANLLAWEAVHIDLAERKRRYFIRVSILFITLIASVPLMNGYILMGNDQVSHLFRIEGIAEGLCAGQFPVRIMPQWWNEYGYGQSMFYGDTLLYLPAILLLMDYKLQTVFKCYIAFINLLTAWFAYKGFVKIGRDERIALLGAGFYTLNLFRLMSIYYNNGVGVYTAMAFLPLVFSGLYCIKEKRGWIYLAAGLTGCIQSHLMTCEMAGIFIILILILNIRTICQKTVFLNLCKAGTVILLWNLWFLVPFLNLYPGDYKLKELAAFQGNIQENGLGFGDWIGTVIASLNGETNVEWLGIFVGLTSVCGLVFVFISLIMNKGKNSEEGKRANISAGFFGGLSLIALFLTTKYFPYDYLCEKGKILKTLIQSLQFPFRFFEMAAIFSAMAIVFGLIACKELGNRKVCILVAGILGGICLLETGFYYQRLLVESPQMAEVCEYYALPEYMGVIEYLPSSAEILYERHQLVTSGDEVEIENYEKKYTTIKASCINRSEQEGYVDVPLFYYPCYKAKDMDTNEKLALTYGENAKIRIILPPGYQGTIKLEVNERKLWKAADLLSIISILAFTGIWIQKKRTGRFPN
ncbi:MAG: hypothetical protein HFI10_06650 [Lachnospiraceae bacterium]|nr:hypothetical protein [Lachnospiraceae bacterium]